jgi:hypothetical protein
LRGGKILADRKMDCKCLHSVFPALPELQIDGCYYQLEKC